MKRVMVDMSATLLHHGHVRLLEKAKSLGHVIVALTTDEEILAHKGYVPELSFNERKEILLALKYVDEVVPSPWLLDETFFKSHNADVLVHSGPNANLINSVVEFDRTEGISSSLLRERAVDSIVSMRNTAKCLLTPGPTNIHGSNVYDIKPVFTRGDAEYDEIREKVLAEILKIAGQDSIIALQGSATTAIEIATSNFLRGRVLVVISGFYSARMLEMIERKSAQLNLQSVQSISNDDFLKSSGLPGNFDWVVASYTETGDAYCTDIHQLRKLAGKARLMLDATGSINLEDHHELADVCMFSSCKGLGGLTGGSFVTFNKVLLDDLNPVQQPFILDIRTHIEKKVTSPSHTICSLFSVSGRFGEMKERVRESKRIFVERFSDRLFRKDHQPALCTKLKGVRIAAPPHVVQYAPRSVEADCAVVCHLFDQFASNRKIGQIYSELRVEDLAKR